MHPTVTRLLLEATVSCPSSAARSYPFYPEFIQHVAGHFGVDQSSVLISAGSDDALKCLIESLATTSKRLIIQDPTYEEMALYARLRNILIQRVEYGSHEPKAFALSSILDLLDRSLPAVVIISNPNGPTGYCLTKPQVSMLAESCRDHNHLLVIDEAYVPYNGFDHLDLLSNFDNVVIVRSFSKSYGLAGGRLCFIASSQFLTQYIARWQTQNAVSGITMWIARYLLEHESELHQARLDIINTRDWFAGHVVKLFPSWQIHPSQANFVNFDTGDPHTAAAVVLELRKHHVLIKNLGKITNVPALSSTVKFGVADRLTMDSVAVLLERMQQHFS